MHFSRIAILGMGQIGASIAAALQHRPHAFHVVGFDLNENNTAYAKEQGWLDEAASSAQEAVATADLILLCTPVGTYGDVMQQIAAHIPENCMLSDVGSIKQEAITQVLRHKPEHCRFIPGHPIAGTERSGPQSANPEFFKDHLMVITPLEDSTDEDIDAIKELWQHMQARIAFLPALAHDVIYAHMSHLPQLLNFANGAFMASQHVHLSPNEKTLWAHVRTSRSDPEMWRDIFLSNQEHILKACDNYQHLLRHLAQELRTGEKDEDAEILEPLAITTQLVPHVTASCLINQIYMLEQQMEISLRNFAAGGFIDFVAPASVEPEATIKQISANAEAVAEQLDAFDQELRPLYDAIVEGDRDALLTLLRERQNVAKSMVMPQH